MKQAMKIRRDRIVFLLKLVMDFNTLLSQNGHIAVVVFVAFVKFTEFDWVIKFFDLGLVWFLTKLSLHRIQHHFGYGSQARIFLNIGWVKLNLFFFTVLSGMLLLFDWVISYIVRSTARFFFDF